MTPRLLSGLAVLAIAATSCFYDSRWGETKRNQRSVARHETPGALAATPRGEDEAPPGRPARAPRVLRLRAHATSRFAAEVVDWRRQLGDVIEDANRVLGPTLDVRLELAAASPWAPRSPDDDLPALLDELAASDPGADVERVVGLAGSVPRYESSFRQLGLAMMGRRHFVIRTMNDAHEYEAIRAKLDELGDDERAKVHRARKRHKTTSVFLHELAHTLSVPHEVDTGTIMGSRYDSKIEAFSPAAAALMRLTVARELEPAAQTDQAFARAVLEHVERTAAAWVPADREQVVARMQPLLLERRAPAPPAAARPQEAAAGGELAALGPADRAVFDQATREMKTRPADAWTTAKPLFAAYPTVYAVQDLRCQLAMKIGMAWQAARTECAPLLRLVPGGAAPKRE